MVNGTKPLSLTVSEIGLCNVEFNAMADMTLINTRKLCYHKDDRAMRAI